MNLSKRDYLQHMHGADKRKIPFRFTYAEWLEWWQNALALLGDGAKRGKKQGQFMMARIDDKGAYEDGNVYAATSAQNARDVPPEVRRAAIAKARQTRISSGKAWGNHLAVRGDAHPKSKAVITPAGRFGSLALAADHYGITRQGAGNRVRIGVWRLDLP